MSIDMEKQYDKLYRYCYFKVKNTALAEDLTQESFLKYFSQDSYIERGCQMAYLYTIARNLCVDAFREKISVPLEESTVGEDPFVQVELHMAIRQALGFLQEEEQELLLLRYANELSMGEIAAFSGISRFAVYRRIKNALAKLKTILRKEDFS